MKEGWEYKKIKDIGSVIGGTTPNTNIAEYWDGALCWISPAELDGSHYLYDSKKKITEAAVRAKSLKLLPEGTVILSSRAPIGKVVINKIPTYCNQGFKCVVCGKDIYNEFLYWWFWGKKEYLNSLGTGATFKEISKKVVEDITVPVPPLSEQQSIVAYLDSAFAKIDAMKANAEKALNEAKALFQASLKEMLEPKEGWEEKKLGEICSDIRYGTSTPSHENGEYKYLRMNNITNDGFLDVSHYKTISLPEKELEKCLVKRGDIIFNRTNSRELVGKSCVFTEDENMVIAGYLIRIRLKEGFEPQFITYSMNLQRSLGLFQHLIVGAVHQANISANNIQKVIINYPPLSEQQSIVNSLDNIKTKVDRLQANFDKISQECDALKQAILRQVFE